MAVTRSTIELRERARRSLIRTLGRVHRTVVRMGGGRLLGQVAGSCCSPRPTRAAPLAPVPIDVLTVFLARPRGGSVRLVTDAPRVA